MRSIILLLVITSTYVHGMIHFNHIYQHYFEIVNDYDMHLQECTDIPPASYSYAFHTALHIKSVLEQCFTCAYILDNKKQYRKSDIIGAISYLVYNGRPGQLEDNLRTIERTLQQSTTYTHPYKTPSSYANTHTTIMCTISENRLEYNKINMFLKYRMNAIYYT